MIGTLPAQQRLEADDVFALRIHHRLVIQHEFVLFQRPAQREFKLAALFGVGVERRFIGEVLAAAFIL